MEITHRDGAHILAKVVPESHALLERLRVEQERRRPQPQNKAVSRFS